jgi:outer membrane protein insertion porin family
VRPLLPPPATFPAVPAPASRAQGESENVIEVRVVGNQRLSVNAVLADVHTRVGEPFIQRVAVEDQRRLLDTGKYSDVQISSSRTDKGILVTIRVTENEWVSKLVVRGNEHFSTRKLRPTINLNIPGPVDRNRIEAARQAMIDKYRGDSYYFVSVAWQIEAALHWLVFEVTEGPRIRVKHISFVFDGPQSYSSFRLRQQIKSRQAIWILSRGKLEEGQLSRDAIDLKAWYRDHGYLDVEATPELRFSEDKLTSRVQFMVREGPRYYVAKVIFEGNTIYSDAELLGRIKMVEGKPYEALQLRRDTEAVKNAYGEIGHVNAAVTSDLIYLSPGTTAPPWAKPTVFGPPALVNLRYRIVEDKPYQVGQITIRGNDQTKERVIRRQVRIFPEELFDTVAVDESKTRLKETSLFKDVKITPVGEDPIYRDALVSVDEADTARFAIGFGVSTNEGLVGTVEFTQQNFSWSNPPESLGEFFTGRSFKGDGQLFRVNLEGGPDVANIGISWREPYLFDQNLSLGAGAFLTELQRDNYVENHTGVNASLGHMFPNRWYGELSVQPELVWLNSLLADCPPEVHRDAPQAFLTSFNGTLVRDRTDSRWLPSRGDRLSLSYRQYVGDYTFAKSVADYSRYWTLYTDALDRKQILAARGEVGSIWGEDALAPVYEQFYGGGLGNIRGFRFRGISPRSMGFPNGVGRDQAIGGNVLGFAGTEYTFPIAGDVLRGAWFVDSGTVEETWGLTTWRASTGFGIRLSIPFFQDVPMSLDFGIPLIREKHDQTQLISFAFGWVF